MKIGITGHRNFDNPPEAMWVEQQIRAKLSTFTELRGLSSLAKGADQIFAGAVLELGGGLQAILPFPGFEATLDDPADLARFHQLLTRCSTTTTLAFTGSRERSYLLAGQYVVDHCEMLLAVWNGKPAAGLGGTADVVSYARRIGRAIYHINPSSRNCSDLAPT